MPKLEFLDDPAKPVRSGSSNPNWRGGISSIKLAEQILTASSEVVSKIKQRFMSRFAVDADSSCWVWTGRVFKSNGRALINIGGNILASKVSFVLFKGDTKGLNVLHTCDNTLCVNPDHLWLGTNLDNSRDMVLKGRTADQNGSKNHSAKLNELSVAEIKRRLKGGESQTILAKEFNVCKQTVCNIANGVGWSHVQ